jgi:hypothetical protein
MVSTGSPIGFPDGQGVRAGKAGVRSFPRASLQLTDCSYRIRGLPKRRSPAVAPAIPPPATTTTTTTTTVCPNPSSSPPFHLRQATSLATSYVPKVRWLLRIRSDHWWDNSFHVRSFSASGYTSETSGCSSRLRFRVQCHQKVCVLSRSFFHRRRKASGIIIRAKTGCVW